jgi:hypothetical protein
MFSEHIINNFCSVSTGLFLYPKLNNIALRAHVLNTTLKGSFFMSNFLYSCGDINSGIADCQSELTFKKIRRKNGGTHYVRILKSTVQ